MQSYSVFFEIDPRRARTRSLKATKNSPADASTGVIFISPARVNLILPKGVSPACPKGSITRAFSTRYAIGRICNNDVELLALERKCGKRVAILDFRVLAEKRLDFGKGVQGIVPVAAVGGDELIARTLAQTVGNTEK